MQCPVLASKSSKIAIAVTPDKIWLKSRKTCAVNRSSSNSSSNVQECKQREVIKQIFVQQPPAMPPTQTQHTRILLWKTTCVCSIVTYNSKNGEVSHIVVTGVGQPTLCLIRRNLICFICVLAFFEASPIGTSLYKFGRTHETQGLM